MEKALRTPAARPRRPGTTLSLTWPIFIELLLQMLVGNADQIMVGWYDPNGVGAIGNANQITSLLLLVFSVICTASMILIAQYLGAEDTKRVNETYTISLVVNGVFGLAIGGLLIALFMSNAGGLWDNTKKYIEAGAEGGKGSDSHKAAVIGDTVGDPFKDTAGPSINTQITVVSLVSSLLSSVFVMFSFFG